MNNEKQYIGTYKVYKVFKKSSRREVLELNLTREQAMRVVNNYSHSNTSMVVFDKQFTADKYYI